MKKMIYIMCVILFSMSSYTEETNGIEKKVETVDRNAFISKIKELKEISDIMDVMLKNYVGAKELDVKGLMHGALKGMAEYSEDPHTNYFTKEQMIDFVQDMKGEYPGVGLIVQKKMGDYLVVVSPVEDTPASKAGMKPRDKIVNINGVATINLTSEESIKLLKGEAGSEVALEVYREKTKENLTFILKREVIKLKYVKAKMLEDKIGYIRLTQFGEKISGTFEKELVGLKESGMEGLILDLRNNPGGSLEEAVKISSFFIKESKIVTTRRKNGNEEIGVRKGKYYGDYPLVVLINEGSASASEIVAGAIKDYKRGLLVGTKSFGKGSVQTIISLPDGDGLKLTIAHYYTPSGANIDSIGIEPNIKIEENEEVKFANTITNIDEKAQKESNFEKVKELKGDKKAEEYINKKDIQLEGAVEKIKLEIRGVKDKNGKQNNKSA